MHEERPGELKLFGSGIIDMGKTRQASPTPSYLYIIMGPQTDEGWPGQLIAGMNSVRVSSTPDS